MKIKRLISLATALFLSLSSLLVLAPQVAHAVAPYTCTWTGAAGGSNYNFNAAGNWSGCNSAAPVAGDGDILVFPAQITNRLAVNNITSLTVGGIQFSGATGSTCDSGPQSDYTISGNAISVGGDITNTMTGVCYKAQSLYVDITATSPIAINASSNALMYIGSSSSNIFALGGNAVTMGSASINSAISGNSSSSLTFDYGTGSNSSYTFNSASPSFDGSIVVQKGYMYVYDKGALGSATGGTTLNSGSDVNLQLSNGDTFSEPLTFNGTSVNPTGDYADAKIQMNFGGITYNADGIQVEDSSGWNATFSGNITLGADTTFSLSSLGKATFTGAISGAHTFIPLAGSTGTLVIDSSSNGSTTANGSYVPDVKTLADITDQQSYGIYVSGYEKQTITADASRGDNNTVVAPAVLINDGTIGSTIVSGTISGSGTVGALKITSGGVVAPGHSPGCLNTGNLTEGGTYKAEIGGTTACTGYDQLKVTGTVDLTNGTLTTSLYNGFKPVKGQTYTIIDNDGSDAVTGTFNNLAEGATFTVDGYVLKISYVGGSGNDVVLTVMSVPAAPNTGFELISTHPIITLVSTTLLALGIALIARRYRKVTAA